MAGHHAHRAQGTTGQDPACVAQSHRAQMLPQTKGTGRFPAAARAGAQKIRNHFAGGALASARLLYYFGETYGSDQSE